MILNPNLGIAGRTARAAYYGDLGLDVNLSSLEVCMALSPSRTRQHEKRVAAFLANVEATEPTRFAEVCEMYPVATETALEAARAREISAFAPEHETDEGEFKWTSLDEFISVAATYEAALIRAAGR